MTQTLEAGSDEMLDALIIGSGFAGLGMGIKLKQAGIDSFLILERAQEVGGAWRENDYPGCACDVESHLYSFSFAPNPRWSQMFAPQAEIKAYLRSCAERFGMLPYLRFGQNVERADYDEASGSWTVRTSAGEVHRARVLVSGMGALSRPAYPKIEGLARFLGKAFHSATWDHGYDLEGKRVAVIGTGASAIQFVPRIAEKVAKLHVFQRTAPWVLSKPDRPMSPFERALFEHLPFSQRLFRASLYLWLEARVLGFKTPRLIAWVEREAKRHLARHIADPALRKKLTPDYTIGCKRILLSDDYYPALARENVEVITDEIREVRERGVVSADGVEREVDAIIFGTGFLVREGLPEQLVFGAGGQDIREAWAGGVTAYKGTTMAGFPNFFMLAGPNTGLGHSSMVYMIESQIAYVLDAVKRMRQEGWLSVEVKPEALRAYTERVQGTSGGSVWLTGCKSWYLDEHGRNTAIWPGFTFTFRKQVRRFDPAAYELRSGPAQRRPEGSSQLSSSSPAAAR